MREGVELLGFNKIRQQNYLANVHILPKNNDKMMQISLGTLPWILQIGQSVPKP